MEEENTNESLYGENAVTGSAEDALKGRDVEILNSNTEKVTTHESEEIEDEETEKTEGEGKEDTPTPEDKTKTNDDKDEESPDEEFTKAAKADQDLQKDLAAKGVDFDAMADEYYKDGGLSEESYKKLEKAGYPKSVVDAYVAGLEATAERFVNTVYEYVGGQEEYAKIASFIEKQNDGSAERFNALIEKGDVDGIRLALDGFKSRMRSSVGYTGRSILGRSSTGSASDSSSRFGTRQEMVKAMSDPRYGRDKSYTEEVQRKTMNSPFIG